jgi:hypothetical protein
MDRFRNALYDARRLFTGWFRRTVGTWALSDAPSITYDGIKLADASYGSDSAATLARVIQALELLKYYDVYQFAQLRRLISTIVVEAELLARAAYVPGTSTCALASSLLRETTASIATALVHEATHARIDRFGVRQFGSRLQRIEQICIQHEIEFVRHFPMTKDLELWIEGRTEVLSRFGSSQIPH